MSVTFDQTKEGYVNGTSMPLAGCGPCSVASIACNISYTTPKQVAAWLANRGAFGSSGTTRAGITVALDHYGFKSTYYTPEHTGGATWKKAMDQMKSLKGDWWAIFLVVGTKNGGKNNLWTSGGHYLAITDLKNGKLYVRDSGSKKRTGKGECSRCHKIVNYRSASGLCGECQAKSSKENVDNLTDSGFCTNPNCNCYNKSRDQNGRGRDVGYGEGEWIADNDIIDNTSGKIIVYKDQKCGCNCSQKFYIEHNI